MERFHPKEALDIIDVYTESACDNFDYPVDPRKTSLYSALQVAKAALRKATPIPVISKVHAKYPHVGRNLWCPTCGVMFVNDMEYGREAVHFCENCGQRLDWKNINWEERK